MGETLGRLWRRAVVLLRWRKHQAELREELAQHAALRAAALEAKGVPPAEAAFVANRAMGPATMMREESHRVWVAGIVEDLRQDIAFAIRMLVRQPLFTAVAVLGLAGGLGFGAAAFSGLNALALRGWDVRDPGRLVAIYATSPYVGNRRYAGFSLEQLDHFRARATTLDGVFTFERIRPDGTGALTAQPVSGDYFETLGVPMALGRSFAPEEDRLGAPVAVIVIAHHWWTRMLDSSRAVLGSVVRVRGVPFTVIGVAARGFGGTDLHHVDGWVPSAAWKLAQPDSWIATEFLASRDRCCVAAFGRLADGVSRDDAARELTALLAQARRPGIDTLIRTARVNPFTVVGTSGPDVRGEILPIFALIFGGVGVVLLLACANVANLQLARAAARAREMQIRLAIGASRSRIIRQLMTENLVLALAAAIPALVIARWLPVWVISIFTVGQGVNLQFAPDWRVLVATLGLALASCLLFGLAPALHATRPPDAQRHRVPLRSVFLSAQVTFCLVLLVAAGLFVRSVDAARGGELGYDPAGLTEIIVAAPANEEAAQRAARLARELPAVMAERGVRVAFTDFAPFQADRTMLRTGAPEPIGAFVAGTSPDYFELLGHTILAGRPFAAGATGTHEIVVNESLAGLLGGVSRALGATVVVDSQPRTVVGVIRDARDASSPREAGATLYRPLAWTGTPRILMRTAGADAQHVAAAVRARDPLLGVSTRPYEWYIDNSVAGEAGAAAMAGALGLLALVLASIGIFGVFAFWVRQRERDIGVRMAFGATRGRIVRMVLGATGRALGWGIVLGLAAAAGVAVVLRNRIYGLSPFDPVAFGSALVVLLVSAAAASLWPAWRATRIDPMEALRSD